MGITMSKLIKHALYVLAAAILAAAILLSMNQAQALDQIIRPYQSVRSSGMGGVRITTGLYDENFFGNPARVTANPETKIQLPDPMVEATSSTIGALGNLFGGTDLSGLGDSSGKVLHGRVQMVFPGVYIPAEKNGWAFGVITSAQFDAIMRESYIVDPGATIDLGPALTYGRKFLEDDALSVGATLHATYRLNSNQAYNFVQLVNGTTTFSPLKNGGQGAHIDFDLGATYKLPWTWNEFSFTTALTGNNFLGGFYRNLGLAPIPDMGRAKSQPFTLGWGVSATKKELWAFTDFTLALEFTDIGNTNGSAFKALHIGTEGRYGVLIPRLGLNQGYFAIGLGLDLSALQLDLAWYGEEMTLNAGGMESRRIALRLGFEI